MDVKYCVECQEREARHWGSNFCEDCFREALKEKVEGEEDGH